VRDLVGTANIKNKYENNTIKPNHVLSPFMAKYLRVVKMPVIRPLVVVHLTGGKLLDNTLDTALVLSSTSGKTPPELFQVA